MDGPLADDKMHLVTRFLWAGEVWQQATIEVVCKTMRINLALPFTTFVLKHPQPDAGSVQQDAARLRQ